MLKSLGHFTEHTKQSGNSKGILIDLTGPKQATKYTIFNGEDGTETFKTKYYF